MPVRDLRDLPYIADYTVVCRRGQEDCLNAGVSIERLLNLQGINRAISV